MNTPNNLEWVDEVLETMACTDCSGYPIDEHAKAKQTIATKLAEARLDDLLFCLDRIVGEDSKEDMLEAIKARIATLTNDKEQE